MRQHRNPTAVSHAWSAGAPQRPSTVGGPTTRGRGCRRLALLLVVLITISILLETTTLQSLQPRASRAAAAAAQRNAHNAQGGPQAELLALASKAASLSVAWTGGGGGGGSGIVVLTHASSYDIPLLSSYLGHASAAGVLPALVVVALDDAAAELAARHGALVHRAAISPSADPIIASAPLYSVGSDGHETPPAHHASAPPLRASSSTSLAWHHASLLLAAGYSVWVADPRVVWRR